MSHRQRDARICPRTGRTWTGSAGSCGPQCEIIEEILPAGPGDRDSAQFAVTGGSQWALRGRPMQQSPRSTEVNWTAEICGSMRPLNAEGVVAVTTGVSGSR